MAEREKGERRQTERETDGDRDEEREKREKKEEGSDVVRVDRRLSF